MKLLTAICIGACLLGVPAARAETTGYVILTTSNIVASSSELTNFVAAKEARGFTVQVVPNTPVAQGGWCGSTGGATGDVAATCLRDWLESNYTNGSGEAEIAYALLIGNPHPTSGDVPMKMCKPINNCPSDFFYADLTGDWDINTNGVYGEWADYNTNGGPDLTTEVIVGRIPYYGDTSDLDAILRDTIDYEDALASESAWRNRSLLPASPVAYGGIWGDYRGFLFSQHLRNSTLTSENNLNYRVYEQTHGLNPPPESVPTTYGKVAAAWEQSRPGAIFWFQHGMPTYTVDIMNSAHAEQASITEQAFAFQGSCLNAQPETTNNLAYTLVRKGCISTVAATRSSWWRYTTGLWGVPRENPPPWSYSASVPHMIDGCASRFVNEGLSIGETLADYKEDVAPPDSAEWENYCIFAIYGCPAVGIRSVKSRGPFLSF